MENFSIVNTWEHRRTLPELLFDRQLRGKRGTFGRRVGQTTPSFLAYRAGWNPTRLQNMILAVGPGTPASVLKKVSTMDNMSTDEDSESNNEENDGIEEEARNIESGTGDDNDDDDDEVESRPRRSRWIRRRDEESNEEEEDDDDNSEGYNSDGVIEIFNALPNIFGMASNSRREVEIDPNTEKSLPSMRHGGCVNTAAWLDCGWRISTAGSSSEALPCNDCPTQLLTSGDDCLLKFWDVRQAMGGESPLSGGSATICPFSDPNYPPEDEIRPIWDAHYKKVKPQHIAGSVIPLATLQTGHNGNIFHASPLIGCPGKVATCGADGHLRLADLETGNSSIIVSPDYFDDPGDLWFRSGMCFSHQFLNKNTGLICSEHGLLRFDLRLPPREQPTQSLLGEFGPCKACAIWSAARSDESLEDGDSVYVFAGGSSVDVILCDLRMTSGSRGHIIQRYRPSIFTLGDEVDISVSGLDLSYDKQEILVSYERDQIYTFPVFPDVNSRAGPTIDHLRHSENDTEGPGEEFDIMDEVDEVDEIQELASYGGHYNRFTFLKNARYAGPRDEFICTGSDSGHAWIYERATGSVVSFLAADRSTCNGVIPHPILPLFITYGIDTTAKLWRATTPVSSFVDDSPAGRLQCHRQSKYEMSTPVKKWRMVHQQLKIFGEDSQCKFENILPDIISENDFNISTRTIRNDLHNLPNALKQNMYAYLRAALSGNKLPVESNLVPLQWRASWTRLRHQADRLGLRLNLYLPWILKNRNCFDENGGLNLSLPWILKNRKASNNENGSVHHADLIPDFPSDWILCDPQMAEDPYNHALYFFNLTTQGNGRYIDFYSERYSNFESIESHFDSKMTAFNASIIENVDALDKVSVHTLLYETMLTLKDAGNEALKLELFDLAARRYDKAIQYGAVASMEIVGDSLGFANEQRLELQACGGFIAEWRPLLKVLIICRLNLALLMLKPWFMRYNHTMEQCQLALQELNVFCTAKAKKKLSEEMYIDIMSLRAKAYFRLGSAQSATGRYKVAIKSFENSLTSSQEANSKPDNIVLKRLSEAKRKSRQKSERQKRRKTSLGNEDG